MKLRHFSICVVGIASVLASTLSFALGLGDIVLKSSYNEPLNAEIRLLQPQDLSANEILISLASREDFARIGLDRDFFLTDLRFRVSLTDPRNPHIKVTSTQPVQEPYLNFLVDAQWPSGRLLREYTLLLDLPVFDSEPAPAPVIQPPVAAPAPPPQPVAPAPAPAPAPVAPPAPAPVIAEVTPPAPVVSAPEPVRAEQPQRVVRQIDESQPRPSLPPRELASQSSKFDNVDDAAESFLRTLSRQAAERKSSFQIQAPAEAPQAPAPLPQRVIRDVQEAVGSPEPPRPVTETPAERIAAQAAPRESVNRQEPVSRPAPRPARPDSLRVGEGDTLWSIASRLRPNSSVSVQQTMLALQEANPEAFIDNNINLLRKGQVLRAPSLSEIEQTSFRQAVAAVKQQNQAWQQRVQPPVISAVAPERNAKPAPVRQEGRLTIGSADSSDSNSQVKGSGASGQGESLQNELAIAQEELDKAVRENSNLKTRVAELEEQIKTLEGLVSLTNDQLKALEVATGKVAQDQQAANDETAPIASEEPAQAQAQAQEQEEQQQAEPAPAPQPAPAPAQPSPSLVDSIIGFILGNLQLLAIGLLAILLVIWFILRSKKKNDEDEEFIDDSELEPIDDGFDEEFVEPMEEEDLFDLDELTEEEPSTGIEAQTDDAVAEAEIYLSLGQTDNAEELLQKEIQQNPDNAQARVALLKVYSQANKPEAFDDQYAQLLPLGNEEANAQAKELRDTMADMPEFDVDSYSLGVSESELESQEVESLEDDSELDSIDLDEELIVEPDFSHSDNLVGDEDEIGDAFDAEDFVDSGDDALDVAEVALDDEDGLLELDIDEGLLAELSDDEPLSSEDSEPEDEPLTNEAEPLANEAELALDDDLFEESDDLLGEEPSLTQEPLPTGEEDDLLLDDGELSFDVDEKLLEELAASGSEPSAGQEPSAQQESSAGQEPSAGQENSAQQDPSVESLTSDDDDLFDLDLDEELLSGLEDEQETSSAEEASSDDDDLGLDLDLDLLDLDLEKEEEKPLVEDNEIDLSDEELDLGLDFDAELEAINAAVEAEEPKAELESVSEIELEESEPELEAQSLEADTDLSELDDLDLDLDLDEPQLIEQEVVEQEPVEPELVAEEPVEQESVEPESVAEEPVEQELAEQESATLTDDDLDLDLDLEALEAEDSDDLSLDIDEQTIEAALPEMDEEPLVEQEPEASVESLADDLDLDDLSIDEPSKENDEFDLDFPPADIDMASLDKELDALLDDDLDALEAMPESAPEVDSEPELEVEPEPELETEPEPVVEAEAEVESESESEPEPEAAPVLDLPAMDLDDDDANLVDASDEIDTKLDLARAYMDMGDREGAEDILQEIIEEAGSEQKQQAEAMLADL